MASNSNIKGERLSTYTCPQPNKEKTAVIENKDTPNELIEQLSDMPCDCENDDTTQRNYPIICILLAPFVALAIMWTFTTYRQGFANIIAKIDDIFNCNFLPIPFPL